MLGWRRRLSESLSEKGVCGNIRAQPDRARRGVEPAPHPY